MCLITNDKTKYIAEEDITVYKVLAFTEDEEYCGRSLFHGYHQYKWGEQPEVEIKESREWTTHDDIVTNKCREIYPQFKLDYWGTSISKEQRDMFMCIGAGYHSMTRERIDWGEYSLVVKCIIPKGAEYYKDMTGLYVSNRLTLVEKEKQYPESSN
jgi:hypothetical protein